jgi:hypothetical protein
MHRQAGEPLQAGPGHQVGGQGAAGLDQGGQVVVDQAAVGDPADAVDQTSATSAGEVQ